MSAGDEDGKDTGGGLDSGGPGPENAGAGGDPDSSRDRAREDAEDLRRRAESRVEEGPWEVPTELEGRSLDQVRRMLHELKVHQVELEMQNEELRQSRAELETSHERYFDLFDLAPVGYFTLSEEAQILEANLTGSELLGVPREGVLGRPFTQFIHPDDQDGYYHHRRAVVHAGSPATCELRMLRADGSTFHALLESAPSLPFPADDRATFRTVVSDVTERTRAATERLLLERRLQQVEKAESLGRMAGAMAHHFNNLLGVITGNLELALGTFSDDSDTSGTETVEELNDALEGARKATALTQLLLAYLGHARSDPILMDLSEVGRRGISLLEIAMPLGTEVVVHLPSPGPLVRADPRDIQQLLTNLVTNAWEASEPGSASIHLTVSTIRPSEIPEENRFPDAWRPEASSYACLEVRDEGPGIEPGKLSEIFDPFSTTKSFGRGLGLPVALGTVKAHSGAMAVTSRPGRGTNVRVFLPEVGVPVADPGKASPVTSLVAGKISEAVESVRRPPTLEGREGEEGREASVEPTTVLVVEDNEMVRRLAVRVLGEMGFQILEAADGVEALEVFQEHQDRIGVVLCDVTMPRMGGWETLAALRRIDPEIPVVLTSGYDEASARSGTHLDQPDAFVEKPWQLDGLRKVLGEVLGGPGGGHGLIRWE
jgi:two-component system, cell cycle sensor histidine kinase and response regulator CckA